MSGYKFYRYQGYSYLIEDGSHGEPVAAFMLQPDGTLVPIERAWQIVLVDNPPITEAEAYLSSGAKWMNLSTQNTSALEQEIDISWDYI